MDAVHDMGGMHGFGAVVAAEPEDMRFHQAWHGRMFALTRTLRAILPYGGDHTRAAIERTDPAWYLAQGDTADGYYAKWLAGHLAALQSIGVVASGELAGGEVRPLPASLAATKPLPANAAWDFLTAPRSARKPDTAPPRFAAGDRVRTLAHGIEGHTRLPRYARGKWGRIECVLGSFPLADAVAAGLPRNEPVYTVVFTARELWGAETADGDSLSLDLWQSYLESTA